jgi:hypothetical protein
LWVGAGSGRGAGCTSAPVLWARSDPARSTSEMRETLSITCTIRPR